MPIQDRPKRLQLPAGLLPPSETALFASVYNDIRDIVDAAKMDPDSTTNTLMLATLLCVLEHGDGNVDPGHLTAGFVNTLLQLVQSHNTQAMAAASSKPEPPRIIS